MVRLKTIEVNGGFLSSKLPRLHNGEKVVCPFCGTRHRLSWTFPPHFRDVGDTHYGRMQMTCLNCGPYPFGKRSYLDLHYDGLNETMQDRLAIYGIDFDKVVYTHRKAPKPHPVKRVKVIREDANKPKDETLTRPSIEWEIDFEEEVGEPKEIIAEVIVHVEPTLIHKILAWVKLQLARIVK